jgi:hypothetical protein
VALLGIAGIGALFVTKPDAALIRLTDRYARWCFVIALIGFGLSAGFGLMHRYFSSDSMASEGSVSTAIGHPRKSGERVRFSGISFPYFRRQSPCT